MEHFWKFEVQRSKIQVTRWPNIDKNAVLKPHALFNSFWRPICDLGILSQTAGGGIPSTLQHRILSSFIFILPLMYLDKDTKFTFRELYVMNIQLIIKAHPFVRGAWNFKHFCNWTWSSDYHLNYEFTSGFWFVTPASATQAQPGSHTQLVRKHPASWASTSKTHKTGDIMCLNAS